ncbi:hypothetical protein F511_29617 [Dorcoceras hygrometricum]|uniref:Uncharacterized protein n=1 Tax=Dorcoceras hygrometricum TaxID=472368 RepID=A0A2Z7C6Y5_9LAMI|nr:hypothetical protein F511_29617 [Dorcoceras hygrometricum]
MTSAVTSSSAASYSIQQEDSADKKRCARYGMSCDDISLDVITISRWLSADEAKRERRSDVVLRFSRWISADDVFDFQSKYWSIQAQEDKSIIVEEDSGETFDEPDASNSSIQSKSLYESAVANQPVTSFASNRHGFPDARIEEVAKRSSRRIFQQRTS